MIILVPYVSACMGYYVQVGNFYCMLECQLNHYTWTKGCKTNKYDKRRNNFQVSYMKPKETYPKKIMLLSGNILSYIISILYILSYFDLDKKPSKKLVCKSCEFTSIKCKPS